jgi:probable rRNA maturation factor
VTLVTDRTMAALNRTYRGVAGPTDVLAFPLREGRFARLARLGGGFLGDVVISVETAARQARPGRLKDELALLLVHGILHLTGYDHGTTRERARMWKKQTALLAACGLTPPEGWAASADA